MSWRTWPPAVEHPLTPADYVLAGYTVDAATLTERIAAARVHGYRGLSLRSSDLNKALAEGRSMADIRQLLDDNGLHVADLDGYTAWSVPADAEDLARHQARSEVIWRAAKHLGARSINLADLGHGPRPLEELAAGFAEVCDRAAPLGLLVHLEPLGVSAVPTIGVAAEIARLAGRVNGGVLLDTWHHFRAGGGPEDLAAVADLIMGVQINDAPATPGDDWMTETLHHRLLPGEGDADVAATLVQLADLGVTVPITVEVMSDQLRQMSPDAAAGVAMTAARTVMAQAARF